METFLTENMLIREDRVVVRLDQPIDFGDKVYLSFAPKLGESGSLVFSCGFAPELLHVGRLDVAIFLNVLKGAPFFFQDTCALILSSLLFMPNLSMNGVISLGSLLCRV